MSVRLRWHHVAGYKMLFVGSGAEEVAKWRINRTRNAEGCFELERSDGVAIWTLVVRSPLMGLLREHAMREETGA